MNKNSHSPAASLPGNGHGFAPEKIRVVLVALDSPSHPVIVNTAGIAALAGDLRHKFGHTVHVSMHDTYFDSVLDIVNAIVREKPHLIGLSVQMGSQDRLVEMMDLLEPLIKTWPEPPLLVFGNVLATFASESLLERYPQAVAVIGEGEIALRLLVSKIMARDNYYGDIPNVRFIWNGSIVTTPRRAMDLSELAPMAMDYIPRIASNRASVWVEASRGCNLRCTFCSRFPVRMTGWNPIPAERVVREIAALTGLYGVRHIRFTDDEFMGVDSDGSLQHAWDIANGIIRNGIPITFDISCRIRAIFDPMDTILETERKKNVFKLLQKAGLTQVYLGVESGSDKQLRRFGKRVTREDNLTAVRMFEELGIQVVMGFITIDYLMELEELKENIDFLRDVGALDEKRKVYVSDPLTSLRAQEGSPYVRALKNRGMLGEHDQKLLTYIGSYQDPRVRRIAEITDEWSDKNQPMLYALKCRASQASLTKDKTGEAILLERFLHEFKLLDYRLLTRLADVFQYSAGLVIDSRLARVVHNASKEKSGIVEHLRQCIQDKFIKDPGNLIWNNVPAEITGPKEEEAETGEPLERAERSNQDATAYAVKF